MNELEQLRFLINAGQATPQQKERYDALLGQSLMATSIGLEPNNSIWGAGIPQGITNSNQPFQGINLPSNPQVSVSTKNEIITDNTWREKQQPDNPTGEPQNLSPASFPTREAYMEYANKMGFDMTSAGEKWDQVKAGSQPGGTGANGAFEFPLIFPGGSDISTELYTLGRSIGAKPGSQGRIATGIGAGGAALFDIGRNVLSGIGYEKRQQYVEDYYRNRMNDNNYVANSQSNATNNLGGVSYNEDGGTIQLFQAGGGPGDPPNYKKVDVVPRPVLQDYQKADFYTGATPMERNYLDWKYNNPIFYDPDKSTWFTSPNQTTTGTHYLHSRDSYQQYLDQLPKDQHGYGFKTTTFKDPETGQMVVVPADAIQPRIGVAPGEAVPAAVPVATPTTKMKNGGTFNKKPGEAVTIIHNGQKVTGVVDRIENGKLYLK